jgi:hypothetical protein
MPKLSDRLTINEKFRDTLRPLSEAEADRLKANVYAEEGFLSPILYYLSPDGGEVIVDGHHRWNIWLDSLEDTSAVDLVTPSTREVMELAGADDETVIKWIRNHQKGRRNQPTVAEQYEIGKEIEAVREGGGTAIGYAEEHDMTPSQARHAALLSGKIDSLEPEVREQILGDEKVTAQEVVDRAVNLDQKPDSPLAVFEGLHKSLAALARASGKVSNEFGDNEVVIERIRSLGEEVRRWEDSCAEKVI